MTSSNRLRCGGCTFARCMSWTCAPVIVPEDGIGARVLPGAAAGMRAGALEGGRHELVPGIVGRGC